MYKETCKTTKFIYFKIQKYCLSMTIKYHSDTLIIFLKLLWCGYCVIGNTNVCCHIPSHEMFPMGFPLEWHSYGQACVIDMCTKSQSLVNF